LVISRGERRGLLLPQVPLEHGWDRITFLEQTCRKAGLPLDAWLHGAQIEAFTAEIFGEHTEL
jgi:AMMECR1 domain-containing protein